MLPGNSRARIFVILKRSIHVALHEQPARKPAHVADFHRDLAGQLARVVRVQHDRIRRFQIGRNAEESAGDRGDGGRRVGKSTGGGGRQRRISPGETRRSREAVRIGEIGRIGEAERAVLIVIHDQIVSELIVGDGRRRRGRRHSFRKASRGIRRDRWARRPARSAARNSHYPGSTRTVCRCRPIQRIAEREIGHLIGRDAQRLQAIPLREILIERHRGIHLQPVRFIRRPEIFVAQPEIESKFTAHAIGVANIARIGMFDERALLRRPLRQHLSVLVVLISDKNVVQYAQQRG